MKFNFRNILYPLSFALGMALVSSCSEDTVGNDLSREETDGSTITLRLYRNSDSWSTRAVHYPDAEEVAISNLYMIAVPEGTISASNPFRLTTLSSPVVNAEHYEDYKVSLFPGNYKFYILANLDKYSQDVPGQETSLQKIFNDRTDPDVESKLNGLILYYQKDEPIEQGHLPMACLPGEILYGPDENNLGKVDATHYVTVPNKSNGTLFIEANMNFLCSKIRYTILFNSEDDGFSTAFGDWKIEFDPEGDQSTEPFATNIRKQTALTLGSSLTFQGFVGQEFDGTNITGDPGKWTLELNRYSYPEGEGADYPKSPSSMLIPWPLNDEEQETPEIDEENPDDQGGNGRVNNIRLKYKNDEEWRASKKRAWQGIVYLPENDRQYAHLEDERITHTLLKFPFVVYNPKGQEFKGVEIKEIELFKEDYLHSEGTDYYDEYDYDDNHDGKHGLRRTWMYDVVALVKSFDPTKYTIDMDIYVRIKPWEYYQSSTTW